MLSPFRAHPARRVAPVLYGAVVEAARSLAFYRDLGVPDSIEGRYEMIVLHIALVLRRLRAACEFEPKQRAAVSQALIDFMAADLDRSMREIGIGDLSVGRYMRRLGEGLYGRAAAYDAALDADDQAALADGLLRNVYGGADPGADRLVRLGHYAQSQARSLGDQDVADIMCGRVSLAPPAEGHE